MVLGTLARAIAGVIVRNKRGSPLGEPTGYDPHDDGEVEH